MLLLLLIKKLPEQKCEGLNCGNGRKPTREWKRTSNPPPLKPTTFPSNMNPPSL